MANHKAGPPSTSLAWSFEMALRAADNAVNSAGLGYEFSGNSYTFRALQDAMVVRELLLELARKAAEGAP